MLNDVIYWAWGSILSRLSSHLDIGKKAVCSASWGIARAPLKVYEEIGER
jgi:hypothetical protein